MNEEQTVFIFDVSDGKKSWNPVVDDKINDLKFSQKREGYSLCSVSGKNVTFWNPKTSLR